MSKRSDTANRQFDFDFWQAHDPAARFAASWELVENYSKRQGRTNKLQLQRSVTLFQRKNAEYLIRAKRASGRPQDLLDAENLARAASRRESKTDEGDSPV